MASPVYIRPTILRSPVQRNVVAYKLFLRGLDGVTAGRREPGLKGTSDEILIRRVVEESDERALAALYDRYSPVVFGAGLRYLGDRTLAEDLVQDVFVSVWRGAASFDARKASLSTWLYRITRNRITDLARRRRARVRTMGEDSADLSGGTVLESEAGDGIEELLRGFDVAGALERLPPVHREVIVLSYFAGLSQREISARTGVPLGTVKSRTTAALRALRDLMNTWDMNVE